MATASSQVVTPTVINVSPNGSLKNTSRVSSTSQPISIGRNLTKPSQSVRPVSTSVSTSSNRVSVIPTASIVTPTAVSSYQSRSSNRNTPPSVVSAKVVDMYDGSESEEEVPVVVTSRPVSVSSRTTPISNQVTMTAPVITQATVTETTSLEPANPIPAIEKVCVPDTPTTEELYASGFCPLETIQVYKDEDSYDVYIKALTKDGFKVLICLDIAECAECILDADGKCVQMMCVEKVTSMPSAYMEACKKCENPNLMGMAYTNGTMMNCVCNGEENHYALLGGDISDPHGIFYGDAAPFPIVRLSDVRKAPKMVHNCIRAMTQEIVAALLKIELSVIDHAMKDAECLKRELCKYKQTLLSKIGQLNGSVRTLEAIDNKYENIKICPQNQEQLLCTRGKVWDNLAHRRLLYGHLIFSAAEVSTTCGSLHNQMKVVEGNQQMLDRKFCDIHNVIEFKRTTTTVVQSD